MLKTFVATLCVTAGLAFAAPIPPVPADEDPLFDGAHLLNEHDADTLRAIQQQSLDLYDTPIVVVTVPRVSDYDADSVETLARRWFDTWRIGTRSGNQGILLLVAVQDRKARIELGGDWGMQWNDHALRVMDDVIVPHFKRVDYAAGILEGVRALEKDLAMKGPRGAPPKHFVDDTVKTVRRYSLLPPGLFVGSLALGVVLLVAGALRRSSFLFFGGVFFTVLAVFTIVALGLALVGLNGGRRRRFGDSFFGGSSSGRSGGFSGGSSGGGGASGSW